MITRYIFRADTAELVQKSSATGPWLTCITRYMQASMEITTMTVAEGHDAECEIIYWRQHSNLYQPNVPGS